MMLCIDHYILNIKKMESKRKAVEKFEKQVN